MKKPNTEKFILLLYGFIILCVIAVCFTIIPKLIAKKENVNVDETTTIVSDTTTSALETTTEISSNNTTTNETTDLSTTDVTETTVVCDTTTNTVLTEQVETTNNTTVPTNETKSTTKTTNTTKESTTKTTKTNTVLETTTTVPTNETVVDNAISETTNQNFSFVKSFSRGTYYCYGCEKTGGSGRKLISCAVGDGYAKGSIASSYLFRNYGYNYNGKRTTVYLEIPDIPEMNGLYYLDDSDAGNSEVIDFFYINESECPFRNVGVIHVNCYI